MPASLPCNVCGTEFARTTEHWHKNPGRSDGLSNICKQCAIARTRDYCERNRDKVREYEKKRRAANADKAREYNKAYRAGKAEELREYSKSYYLENRAKALARAKKRRTDHGDRINEERRAYRAAHPTLTMPATVDRIQYVLDRQVFLPLHAILCIIARSGSVQTEKTC